MTNIYQGDTAKFEFTVRDSAGKLVNLTGASAIFSYKTSTDETTTTVAGTINGSVITVTLSSTITSDLLGQYIYEVKIKDSGNNVDTVFVGKLNVAVSIAPDFITI